MKNKTTKKPVKKTTKKAAAKKVTPKQKPISVIKFNAAEIQLLQNTLSSTKKIKDGIKYYSVTCILLSTDGDIVATNGQSMVVINKKFNIKKDLLVSLPMKIKEGDIIELDLSKMVWIISRKKETFKHAVTSIKTFKYPDYKSVIPKDDGIVYKTCVDMDLIPKGLKVTMNFYEYGTAPIKCKLNSDLSYDGDIKDVTFLLMPIKLKDGQAGLVKK
jgi:hypothetical protein